MSAPACPLPGPSCKLVALGGSNAQQIHLLCLAVALSLATFAAPAQAQYPERNITLIVPYAAGGAPTITARMLARDLEAELGKPVTVENRAGGGGWVGWGALAQS